MDRGAWWATVPGVAKGWTRLSDSHFHFGVCGLETAGQAPLGAGGGAAHSGRSPLTFPDDHKAAPCAGSFIRHSLSIRARDSKN